MTTESTSSNSSSPWSTDPLSSAPTTIPTGRSDGHHARHLPPLETPSPQGTPREGQETRASASQDAAIDPQLIDRTREQIRVLVDEIAALAKSNCAPADFWSGFLTRTTAALASVGGAIWLRESNQHPLELQYQINLSQTDLANNSAAQLRHHELLNQVLANPDPHIIPPHSGNDRTGNPTPFLILFAPFVVEQEVVGLIEILQRPGGGPATQRGYLRFVSQMADIAADYLKSHRLKLLTEQQRLWRELDRFTTEIHADLNPSATASAVANEGRRVIGCDRVAVAWLYGHRAKIESVSGLDTVERRADQLKRLAVVVERVARTGEPLWYGSEKEKQSDLPPQLDEPLQAYLDRAHTRSMAVIPLKREIHNSDQSRRHRIEERDRRPFAALVVEQLAASEFEPVQRERIELVARHAAAALANAREHHAIFGLPVWKGMGQFVGRFTGSRKMTSLAGVILLVAAIVALAVVPYPFTLSGQGELVAEHQYDIFAPLDGTLVEIYQPNDPQDIVRQGHPLALMVNNDLAVEIEKLEGQLKRAEEEVRRFENSQIAKKLDQLERITIEGELAKARLLVESTRLELHLVRQQAELLTVRSPIDGHVVNWQLKRTLLGRPVTRGQKLMTVVSPDTRWQVEIYLPEKRVGHLLAARDASHEPLVVTFALVSRPGQEFVGRVEEIDRSLDVFGDQGNSCRVLVSFDNSVAPRELLRAGTRVVGKIHVGYRSIGYVWFHELIDTLRMGFRFWIG